MDTLERAANVDLSRYHRKEGVSVGNPIREFDLPKFIDSLHQREFFGKVTIEFNRGQVKLVRTEETQLVEGESQHGNGNSVPHPG